jgi:predicted RNA-binding Zn-ribbon protein involved in translation (DUF1610 family)
MVNRENFDRDLQQHDVDHDLEILYGVHEALDLQPDLYPGGIAMWGALPAPFDTSQCQPESGVHVHARKELGKAKSIDATFESVRVLLTNSEGKPERFTVEGDDAVAYGIGNILGFSLTYVRCPECSSVHSDREWKAVHYHTNHTCEHCGASFQTEEGVISNPVMFLKEICGDVLQKREIIDPVDRTIPARTPKFVRGIQMWGSNPALVWTSSKLEEGGVHFHGFIKDDNIPSVDETFGIASVDGVNIDPEMCRHIMAQNALPYLKDHLDTIYCPQCGGAHFDSFATSVDPHESHECEHCGHTFPSDREVVSNPLVEIFASLAEQFAGLFPDRNTPNAAF